MRVCTVAVWVAVLLTPTALLAPAVAQNVDYANYVESVQVLLDAGSGEVSASILLQSFSTDDMEIPVSLERDIREHGRIMAVVFTDIQTCVPGVQDEACVIVNMARIAGEADIAAVQRGARVVADGFVPRINEALGLNATFHSVFVHHDNTQSLALDIPGTAVGRNTVSAVYTVPRMGAPVFYGIVSSNVLAPEIYDGGGFADAAAELARAQNATVTFAAIPGDGRTLMQLKVTKTYDTDMGDVVDPLALLGVGTLEKSARFGDGFYPLNTLVRLAVVSPDNSTTIHGARATVLDSAPGGIPDDPTQSGWVFYPDSGNLIRGTYLLGYEQEVSVGQTEVYLNGASGDGAPGAPPAYDVVVVLVVAAGGAAAAFYLRGYRAR